MKPNEIESLSFDIIDSEAKGHGFYDREWKIVRRMIHTSADFEYINTIRFHPKAIDAGISAIRSGCNIITDTEMAKAGIRKKDLESFGGKAICLIGSEKVKELAENSGRTRAKAAVDSAIDLMEGGIYAVGNAPTALLRLIELIKNKKAKPALVIGLPVGFVNAAESKDELMKLDFPYISNQGRKGGSNIAASVVNALLLLAKDDKI